MDHPNLHAATIYTNKMFLISCRQYLHRVNYSSHTSPTRKVVNFRLLEKLVGKTQLPSLQESQLPLAVLFFRLVLFPLHFFRFHVVAGYLKGCWKTTITTAESYEEGMKTAAAEVPPAAEL